MEKIKSFCLLLLLLALSSELQISSIHAISDFPLVVHAPPESTKERQPVLATKVDTEQKINQLLQTLKDIDRSITPSLRFEAHPKTDKVDVLLDTLRRVAAAEKIRPQSQKEINRAILIGTKLLEMKRINLLKAAFEMLKKPDSQRNKSPLEQSVKNNNTTSTSKAFKRLRDALEYANTGKLPEQEQRNMPGASSTSSLNNTIEPVTAPKPKATVSTSTEDSLVQPIFSDGPPPSYKEATKKSALGQAILNNSTNVIDLFTDLNEAAEKIKLEKKSENASHLFKSYDPENKNTANFFDNPEEYKKQMQNKQENRNPDSFLEFLENQRRQKNQNTTIDDETRNKRRNKILELANRSSIKIDPKDYALFSKAAKEFGLYNQIEIPPPNITTLKAPLPTTKNHPKKSIIPSQGNNKPQSIEPPVMDYEQMIDQIQNPVLRGAIQQKLALQTLGIDEDNPTWKQVRDVYHRLVRIHHPDKGGSEEKFKETQKAYETLKDSKNPNGYLIPDVDGMVNTEELLKQIKEHNRLENDNNNQLAKNIMKSLQQNQFENKNDEQLQIITVPQITNRELQQLMPPLEAIKQKVGQNIKIDGNLLLNLSGTNEETINLEPAVVTEPNNKMPLEQLQELMESFGFNVIETTPIASTETDKYSTQPKDNNPQLQTIKVPKANPAQPKAQPKPTPATSKIKPDQTAAERRQETRQSQLAGVNPLIKIAAQQSGIDTKGILGLPPTRTNAPAKVQRAPKPPAMTKPNPGSVTSRRSTKPPEKSTALVAIDSEKKLTQKQALEILGLMSGATEAEVSKAWRKFALKHHPDKNENGPTAFQVGDEAREALLNKNYYQTAPKLAITDGSARSNPFTKVNSSQMRVDAKIVDPNKQAVPLTVSGELGKPDPSPKKVKTADEELQETLNAILKQDLLAVPQPPKPNNKMPLEQLQELMESFGFNAIETTPIASAGTDKYSTKPKDNNPQLQTIKVPKANPAQPKAQPKPTPATSKIKPDQTAAERRQETRQSQLAGVNPLIKIAAQQSGIDTKGILGLPPTRTNAPAKVQRAPKPPAMTKPNPDSVTSRRSTKPPETSTALVTIDSGKKLTQKQALRILGLMPGATEAEVSKAWRTFALKHHPDKSADGPTAFQVGDEARKALLNKNYYQTAPKLAITDGSARSNPFSKVDSSQMRVAAKIVAPNKQAVPLTVPGELGKPDPSPKKVKTADEELQETLNAILKQDLLAVPQPPEPVKQKPVEPTPAQVVTGTIVNNDGVRFADSPIPAVVTEPNDVTENHLMTFEQLEELIKNHNSRVIEGTPIASTDAPQNSTEPINDDFVKNIMSSLRNPF